MRRHSRGLAGAQRAFTLPRKGVRAIREKAFECPAMKESILWRTEPLRCSSHCTGLASNHESASMIKAACLISQQEELFGEFDEDGSDSIPDGEDNLATTPDFDYTIASICEIEDRVESIDPDVVVVVSMLA